MWARTRGAMASFVALAAVLVVLVVLAGGIAPAQAPDADGEATPPPGSLLLALRSLGQVNAVLPTGGTLVLARNLAQPVAVAVLSDSSILVAENGANRVSGFGGRFGATPVARGRRGGSHGLGRRGGGRGVRHRRGPGGPRRSRDG